MYDVNSGYKFAKGLMWGLVLSMAICITLWFIVWSIQGGL